MHVRIGRYHEGLFVHRLTIRGMASRHTRKRVRVRDSGFRRCESMKVGYPSREEAWTVAEQQMECGQVKPGCHLTPYQCGLCDEWHVGNRVIVQVPGRRSRPRHR